MKLIYLIESDSTNADKAFAYKGYFYYRNMDSYLRCGRETRRFPYCNDFKIAKLNQVLTQEFLNNQ